MMGFLIVFLGAGIGGSLRHAVNLVAMALGWTAFPFGTLAINVLGSFLIGVVQQAALTTHLIPETLRLVLAVGVMGGFTTYSSFSYETIRLFENGAWIAAVLYIVLTTALCLGGCVMGLALGGLLVEGRGW